jgi:hypothetical protein
MLRRLFGDLRLLCALMVAWLGVVLALMIELGVLRNPTFVAWGPRPTLIFLHMPIDTEYKYAVLLGLIMVHTFVSDFISDGLVPHVINQLQDVRCRRLPHRHGVYYVVTSIWSLYSAVSYLFLICLALGQLDLLLVRLASDLLANFVTTRLYLEYKTGHDEAELKDVSGRQEDEDDAPADADGSHSVRVALLLRAAGDEDATLGAAHI